MKVWHARGSSSTDSEMAWFQNLISQTMKTEDEENRTANAIMMRDILCRGRGQKAANLPKDPVYVVDPKEPVFVVDPFTLVSHV